MSHVIKSSAQKTVIHLDDKEIILHFDLNAMALVEDKFGTIKDGLDSIAAGKLQAIRYFLWAGMTHNHVLAYDDVTGEPTGYSVKLHQVGSWIDVTVLEEVTTKLFEAINASSPDVEVPTPEEVQAAPSVVPEASTGESNVAATETSDNQNTPGTDPNV